MAALTAWLFAVGTLWFLYTVVSKRLSPTIVTGPMLFVTVGLIIGSSGDRRGRCLRARRNVLVWLEEIHDEVGFEVRLFGRR